MQMLGGFDRSALVPIQNEPDQRGMGHMQEVIIGQCQALQSIKATNPVDRSPRQKKEFQIWNLFKKKKKRGSDKNPKLKQWNPNFAAKTMVGRV